MIEEAVSRAGSTQKETLLETLKAGPFMTLCGKNRVQESGYGEINTYPSQILKGNYEIIWPCENATARHVYPWERR